MKTNMGRSMARRQDKVGKVMREFKEGDLHSGSKRGPKVKNRRQAVAIALSEQRRAGKKDRMAGKAFNRRYST